MGIYRSTDPATWDDIDGIVIAEETPPASIKGASTNIACCVGQFQRGPTDVTEVGSAGELRDLFGADSSFSGYASLMNKKFGRLKIARVVASAAAAASFPWGSTTADPSLTLVMTFAAKYTGAYGNNIQVKVEAGSTAGKKITVHDDNTGATLPDEVYDDFDMSSFTTDAAANAVFAESKLVTVAVDSTARGDGTDPVEAGYTNLNDSAATHRTAAPTAGSDDTVADVNYQTALIKLQPENICKFVFLDAYDAADVRAGYVQTHCVTDTTDKIGIICDTEAASVANLVTMAASFRSDRLILGFPWVKTTIDSASVYQNPCSWIASLLSQTAAYKDPAAASNAKFLAGVTGLKLDLKRSDYVSLDAAGVMGIEFDGDIGYKIKNGVTTHILNSALRPVLRRRMADYLQDSIAVYLKNFQDETNSLLNRIGAKGAIELWIQSQKDLGILPKDSEVTGGLSTLVDIDSLNTDEVIANGYFYILLKQRIYSSMRYIVLKTQIGTSVVVTEAG
jgi:hypothetical protein